MVCPDLRGRGLGGNGDRSEEHTSELQSLRHLVCRLLLEKKKRPNLSLGAREPAFFRDTFTWLVRTIACRTTGFRHARCDRLDLAHDRPHSDPRAGASDRSTEPGGPCDSVCVVPGAQLAQGAAGASARRSQGAPGHGSEQARRRASRVHVHDGAGHFFFNDAATTEIYTLSLHDALPI